MSEDTGKIIVILSGKEVPLEYDTLSVNFDSSDDEILDAIGPVILEQEGFDLKEEQDEGLYTLKRVEDSKNIFVFPKSTAGSR